MTYANDCIQERRRGLKRITRQSNKELDAAVNRAVKKYGDDFWILLHGIDAYMERRGRRSAVTNIIEYADPWGDS
jgi:hypothetical protein